MMNDTDDKPTQNPPPEQQLAPQTAQEQLPTIEDAEGAVTALEEASESLSEAGTLISDSDFGGAATTINEVINTIGQVLDFLDEQTADDDDDDASNE